MNILVDDERSDYTYVSLSRMTLMSSYRLQKPIFISQMMNYFSITCVILVDIYKNNIQCNEITYTENISLGKHSMSRHDFSYPLFHCIFFSFC